ncbi:fatty acid desaturase [Bradyrhizobium elkanii]|uniref:fatty acid desaturase n=1 Tax=Bradyrhizobium elkanii TaxID=29448 RepID=UPI00209F7496|nr:fatty acid desaturase [Bradyrhizobium elkanii]MCP1967143.1 fatty acid desaturase [Bradyrhizobium elkanii]MCS3523312.1 fatty acid desaturase [Bradyrhizobium elkanii]MCS4070967.1 fatty acid desaturase [Bradyrhizobium elkanii]MCS4077598.1 fatty acid desaturase [Bradyrhizobium elkanii]MCS4111352.1 fatty acid desaturase [Bradyrhizobium elkanii]
MSTAETSDVGPRLKPLSPLTLRDLSTKSNLAGAVRAASHYGMIVIVGALISLISSRYDLPWALPLIAVQGYFVAFLFMVVHETAHKTAFRSPALNLVVGNLSAFMIGLPYQYYCLFHWDHHRYTQDPEKDPELMVGPKPASDTQLAIAYSGLLQVLVRIRLMFWHALTGKVVVPWIPEPKRGSIVLEARLYLAGYLLLLAASFALHSAILLWVWIVPLLAGQLILRPYLYAEHTGCERTRSAFENTRTTMTGRIMKWFAWNMPYHVEHHAYPTVPFHALPKLNAIVDGHIVYRGSSYRAVTRETWAWFRGQRQRSA